jgi:hypothetical protein
MSNQSMEVVAQLLAALSSPAVLLQAEVVSKQQAVFEARYQNASGITVSPGGTGHYQDQPDKWGAELRVYFNGENIADILKALGVAVEGPRKSGYMSDQYSYRFNNNELWWILVERHGLRLGPN